VNASLLNLEAVRRDWHLGSRGPKEDHGHVRTRPFAISHTRMNVKCLGTTGRRYTKLQCEGTWHRAIAKGSHALSNKAPIAPVAASRND
jgi:hypothetical protein